MVTLELEQTAQDIGNILEGRNVVDLVAVAGSTAGGIYASQILADRVLPAIGFSPDPETLLETAASAGLKGGGALATGYAATQVDGVLQIVALFASVGMLTNAGMDIVGAFVDLPALRARLQGRSTGRASRRRVTSGGSSSSGGSRKAKTTTKVSARKGSSSSKKAKAGGNNF